MWKVSVNTFDPNRITHYGNQFLIGHLKIGVRGTLDEFEAEQKVGINLPFVYDQVSSGWREPVNGFNPLFTSLLINGEEAHMLHTPVISHVQELDMKKAMMTRTTIFQVQDIQVTLTSERFVSANDERVILGRYQITLNKNATIQIHTGVDAQIWDIYGPHIKDKKFKSDDYLYVSGLTIENEHQITCIKKVMTDINDTLSDSIKDDKVLKHIIIHGQKDVCYHFDQYAIIGVDQSDESLMMKLNEIIHRGYENKRLEHQHIWENKWKMADVVIEGDEQAQLAIRYSIYHLLILSPHMYDVASIPARGISGQTYKGAIFWDTEIFMLPFFLNSDTKSAKKIIQYRINALKGAKEKAESYGFKGAFYAWESQEDGYDACTDYNVIDVFSNRPIRTYFKDKQIHISGDIVYAIKSYIERTHDFKILKEGALEVIIEVARFYLDYGKYHITKDRFEIWDVMGPDEYHERVHNNAFTNRLVKMVFDYLLYLRDYYINQKDSFFEQTVTRYNFDKELLLIESLAPKVYLKKPNSNHLIEQFDGYFQLKNVELKYLLNQRIHQNEYLGGSGLAGDTQIIKQADVIAMMYLFRSDYQIKIMEENWQYYEPRTEHGSSLSSSMYALVSCLIGKPNYAYPLFMKSATIDMTGLSKEYTGNTYIGGTHPAASGGAYMTAIYGFAGLSFEKGIQVNPQLPSSINQIKFHILHHGKKYKISVSKNQSTIEEVQL